MIKIIGNWKKRFLMFQTDSQWPGPRSYSPGNTVTHSRLQIRFNITRDTFTLHDQQRDPFTFLYTYIQLPVRLQCLSVSLYWSFTSVPFTLAAFHRLGIGKLFHASKDTLSHMPL